MLVLELDRRHRRELEAHFGASAALNVFPLDLLEHNSKHARFFIARDAADRICSTVLLVGGGRLAVPEGDPGGVSEIARELCRRFEIQRVIGPTAATTALADALEFESPRLDRIHRLLQITKAQEPPSSAPRLEPARASDVEEILQLSAAMHIEELGIDPRAEDEEAFERSVLTRLERGRSFVIRESGRIVFKADLGSDCRFGAQIEGVYTVPFRRNRGLATSGLSQLVARQLHRRPRVTLHVFEENRAALKAYDRVGFEEVAQLRLISAD